ncbi:helix-turn-helix domain-containing protein [Methylobacterium sp. NEAU 140]|uniref:helix-turn-helix domain-containing protein n=1 Tax=Methylobacterium sp. NEAU 140 TaxID=3064945 RepID=UPI0027365DF8|nr:helix-turn-helix domain-containing protein [Methylobacterium sp. NEAU 140]MDP4026854.1 helix-turn-helix domain-containing protein [Methylobacterium sp. NEAU 140]
MFADELRAAIERAPRITLPSVTALLWRAYGDGQVTEAEAEALSALIETRRALDGSRGAGQTPNSTRTDATSVTNDHQDRQNSPRRPGVGSRPRTDASMERRRRWAASGRLPPALAARFTLAEQAVLALVASEVARRKDCRMAIEHMAAVAGVCRSTVKNAIREARRLGLLTVEERQVTGFRNLPNVVRVVSPEWTAWLRLGRRTPPPAAGEGGRHRDPRASASSSQGGGVKSATGTRTQVLESGTTRPADPKKGCRRAAGDPRCSDPTRIRAGGGTGGAMR